MDTTQLAATTTPLMSDDVNSPGWRLVSLNLVIGCHKLQEVAGTRPAGCHRLSGHFTHCWTITQGAALRLRELPFIPPYLSLWQWHCTSKFTGDYVKMTCCVFSDVGFYKRKKKWRSLWNPVLRILRCRLF